MHNVKDNVAPYIYLNGNIINCGETLDFEIPFIGSVIYEVVRFVDRKGVFLKDHYNRFVGSLALASMENCLSYEEYKRGCIALLEKNNIDNNNLKLMYAFHEETKEPLCLIYASKSFYPEDSYYTNGITTAVLEVERPNPNAKINRKEYVDKVTDYRLEKNVFEVLLENTNGELTEGSRSNLFFIQGNRVLTAPSSMVLEGVMRKYVFEIGSSLNICIDDSVAVSVEELDKMDAAFLTGTSINVLPVAKVDENIKYDTHNPVLMRLIRGFEERIAEEGQKN